MKLISSLEVSFPGFGYWVIVFHEFMLPAEKRSESKKYFKNIYICKSYKSVIFQTAMKNRKKVINE